MNYRILGRTNLNVSEISLGTWAFGNNVYGGVEEKVAIRTIHSALHAGVNLFDTAPQYGTITQDGVAEIVLGKALKNRRDEVFISTKFGRNPTIAKGSSQFNKSRIVDSVDESLIRLQTDHIDILFFHSPFSPEEIKDDVWEGIEEVRRLGKVRFIGHSISKLPNTRELALNWAKEDKIDVVQVVLSLMNRESQDLINELQDYKIGVMARECLANGFLTNDFSSSTKFSSGTLNARYSSQELQERLAQVEAFGFLAEKKTMSQAALRWVLDQKFISTVLSGAKDSGELKDAIMATELPSYSELDLRKAETALIRNFEAA